MAEVVSEEFHTREIRVFLSSTFNDMEAERTHLVKEVFPRFRAACAERMVGFTEIDLRWGITEDESKNGETVEICLSEIDRCRAFPPFFIGFLGERYGWIPDEQAVQQYWAKHPSSGYVPLVQQALERGLSVTEMEMELAVLAEGAAEKLHGQVLFLLRDPALTDAQYKAATGREPDRADRRFFEPAGGKLDALKDRLRSTPFLGIDGYRSIEEFGAAVEAYLLERLDRYFPQASALTPLERTRLEHSSFRQHRLRFFMPREAVKAQLLTAMQRRVEQPVLGPIVLNGPSGQGKSAVLADLTRYLETQDDDEVHWRVIDHYVGADGIPTLDGWLDRVLQTLHPELRDTVGDVIPVDPEKRRETLPDWLARAARQTEQKIGRPVRFALIVDALDQLLDEGKDLRLLLSDVVGPSAVIIASAATSTAAFETITSYAFETVALPPLMEQEARAIVADLFSSYRKTLPDALLARLVRATQAGNPLFLQLALEELRLDARHETLEATLDTILKCKDAAELFLTCFLRDPDYQRVGQSDLLVQFFALQAASYNGLSELELADLLALPNDPIAEDTGKPRLPQVVMSRLVGVFWPFMLTKEGRRAPMHRVLGQAALHEHGEKAAREKLHRHFHAEYSIERRTVTAPRAAAEALHQLERLAARDAAARKRLRKALSVFFLPCGLHKTHSEIVLQSLRTLGQAKFVEMAKYDWLDCVETADLSNDDPLVEMGSFLSFLSEHGFVQEQTALWMWLFDTATNSFGLQDTLAIRARHGAARALAAEGAFSGAKAQLEMLLSSVIYEHGDEHPEALNVMSDLAQTLYSQGEYPEALAMQKQIISLLQQSYGPDHKDTLSAMGNLAATHMALGELHEALSLSENVLQIRQRKLGPGHKDTLLAMNNFAGVLRRMGHFGEARELLEQVLKSYQHTLGADHPMTLSTTDNIAGVMGDQGDFQNALVLQKRTLEERKRVLGQEHPTTIESMNNVAGSMAAQGDWGGARALFEQALKLQLRRLGADHPNTLTIMNGIAACLANQGDFHGSRSMREQILEQQTKRLGPEHPDTIKMKLNLAGLDYAQGNFAQAQQLEEEVVESQRAQLGAEHPDTLTTMNNLARTIYARGDLAAARVLQEQVLSMRQDILGAEHPDTLASMSNLALTLRAQGAYAQARVLQERVLQAEQTQKGPAHSNTLTAMNNLAGTLRMIGALSDAQKMQEQVLEADLRLQGAEHPGTLVSMFNLALTLHAKGELDQARQLHEHVFETRLRVLGAPHQNTLKSANELGVLLHDEGNTSAALAILEQTIEMQSRFLGLEHPNTLKSMSDLGRVLLDDASPDKASAVLEKAYVAQDSILGPEHPETQKTLELLQKSRDGV